MGHVGSCTCDQTSKQTSKHGWRFTVIDAGTLLFARYYLQVLPSCMSCMSCMSCVVPLPFAICHCHLYYILHRGMMRTRVPGGHRGRTQPQPPLSQQRDLFLLPTFFVAKRQLRKTGASPQRFEVALPEDNFIRVRHCHRSRRVESEGELTSTCSRSHP